MYTTFAKFNAKICFMQVNKNNQIMHVFLAHTIHYKVVHTRFVFCTTHTKMYFTMKFYTNLQVLVCLYSFFN